MKIFWSEVSLNMSQRPLSMSSQPPQRNPTPSIITWSHISIRHCWSYQGPKPTHKGQTGRMSIEEFTSIWKRNPETALRGLEPKPSFECPPYSTGWEYWSTMGSSWSNILMDSFQDFGPIQELFSNAAICFNLSISLHEIVIVWDECLIMLFQTSWLCSRMSGANLWRRVRRRAIFGPFVICFRVAPVAPGCREQTETPAIPAYNLTTARTGCQR